MKKGIIIAVAALAAGAAFLGALVAVVNARGGVDPSHAGITKVPLIGALVKEKAAPAPGSPEAQGPVAAAAAAEARDMSFLRFGAESRLSQLVEELESKKAEYEALLLQAQRRARELEAWERQLKVERDSLRDKFGKEKEDLAAQRQQLEQKGSDLAALQLKIDENEAANLKTTAGIYDKMSPEQAAAILAQMFAGGQQDSVVKIISLMQDRSAAKTLESFTDAKIGAQITEQLQRIARPTKVGG